MGSKDYIPPTRPTQTLPFTYVCPLPYYSSAPKRPTACVALDSTTDLVMVPVHFRRLGSSAVEQGNHNPLVGSSNLSRATNLSIQYKILSFLPLCPARCGGVIRRLDGEHSLTAQYGGLAGFLSVGHFGVQTRDGGIFVIQQKPSNGCCSFHEIGSAPPRTIF